MALLAIFIGLLFLHSLVAARLERTVFTAPILFTAAGILACLVLPDLPIGGTGTKIFHRIAEVGLVLLLFTDASRTDLRVLSSIRALPIRLLSAGLLLTIGLGMLAALVVLGHLSVWEAGILAAILAPTDAGLGQVIVTSPKVPIKIREALSIEAGLNDGLSVPFLLFFIALATSATATTTSQPDLPRLTEFILEQLGYGTAIGLVIGLAGGWLLARAHRMGTMTSPSARIGIVTLPLLCMLTSHAAAASMFIAAFVAGLAVRVSFKHAAGHSGEFAEDWGQFLNLSVFFLFGMLVARDWHLFTPALFLYALLSLTVVRMLPVALSLIRTRLAPSTVLFMGWFGPRGLASIVLTIVYLEETHQTAIQSTVALAAMVTILVSIFAHGFTALPLIHLYARKLAKLPPSAPEIQCQ